MIADGMWPIRPSWPAFLPGKPAHRHKLYIWNVKDFEAPHPRKKTKMKKRKHLKHQYNFCIT